MQFLGWAGVFFGLMVGFRLLTRRVARARRRAVYEIRNESGRGHFYIGTAFDVPRRMRGHRRGSWWFRHAPARFRANLVPDRVTWYPNAAAANAAEVALIRKHQPWANTRGTRHGKRRTRR